MRTRRFVLGASAVLGGASLASLFAGRPEAAASYPVTKPDAAWRKQLSGAQYDILRRNGTERPYTSPLLKEGRRGVFACAGCDQGAYASETKFDSGTGWPSFWAPVEGAVVTETDRTFGMTRIAVHCSRCGGHHGHVFEDGPKPTGLRYCINGVALTFRAVGA